MTRAQWLTTVWMSAIVLASCGENLSPLSTGVIEVTVATTGAPTDSDGYTLSVDGGEGRALGVNTVLRIPDLPIGDHDLALDDIATNCLLTGVNPRTVNVSGGAATRTTFDLVCSIATGSIELTASTTGESLDPDGYLATLDGNVGRSVESNGMITFNAVTEGNHTVRLTAMDPNCTTGENPRTVAVGADAVPIRFDIVCGPRTGSIHISTTTGGVSLDPDGYTAAVDGGAEQAIDVNGNIEVPGLPVGDHTVRLSGLASNCAVGGANPLTVAVTNGGVALAAFQVSCAPTGTGTILFASDRSGTMHLYKMREDGSSIADLTPTMESFDGDWSPDGSRIAFTATREGGIWIFVMNADGSNPVWLGVAGSGPKWSPDGRKILWSDGTIRVMSPDGSNVVNLAPGDSPDWSPDGTRIAFHRTDWTACVGKGFLCPADVYVMNADGSQVRRLTNATDASDRSTSPAWSPDGTTIAYARRCCFLGANLSGLYRIGPDGGSSTRIDTRPAAGRPVWSPDGSAIAFAVALRDGTSELTLVASTGGPGGFLASSPGSEFPESWR